ncbi:MAG: CPBP family intramembrane metalloprotease [Armatimonadetes bacterium]|nr:CPBP family intramembrane metalloprotease [Armatimonadota bacterium]
MEEETRPVESQTEEPPGSPWGGWATLGLTAGILFIFVAVSLLIGALFGLVAALEHHKTTMHSIERLIHSRAGLVMALSVLGSAPIGFGVTLLLATLRKNYPLKEYLGFRNVPIRVFLEWLLLLIVFIACWDLLTYALGKPIVLEKMIQAYKTARFLPLFYLAIVVVGPIFEETLMRGFLFQGIRSSPLGATGAVVVTAFLWALLHMGYGAYGFLQILLAGLLLGIVRLRSASTYVTIGLHMFMNMVATIETAVVIHMR